MDHNLSLHLAKTMFQNTYLIIVNDNHKILLTLGAHAQLGLQYSGTSKQRPISGISFCGEVGPCSEVVPATALPRCKPVHVNNMATH